MRIEPFVKVKLPVTKVGPVKTASWFTTMDVFEVCQKSSLQEKFTLLSMNGGKPLHAASVGEDRAAKAKVIASRHQKPYEAVEEAAMRGGRGSHEARTAPQRKV